MEYRKFCFGLVDVRKGTKIIAFVNMGILSFTMFFNLLYLAQELSPDIRLPNKEIPEKHSMKNTLREFSTLNVLFLEVLFFYFNIKLKKSTVKKNVQDIKNWLSVYLMFLTYTVISYCCMSYTSKQPILLLIGFFCAIATTSMMVVVKRFYQDELECSDPYDDTAILHQSTPENCLSGHDQRTV